MKKFVIVFGIGLVAGVIDVTPMVIQGVDTRSNVSAFVHWVVLSVLIPYIRWSIKPWIKGLLVAEISALPIMVLVSENGPSSIVPMSIMSAILGALVGIAGNKLVKL